MNLESMTPVQQAAFADMINAMNSKHFENEHGEKFAIHSNGTTVFMSGDEVTAMVDKKNLIAGTFLPLFNDHFSVWNKAELWKLGKALQELAEIPG